MPQIPGSVGGSVTAATFTNLHQTAAKVERASLHFAAAVCAVDRVRPLQCCISVAGALLSPCLSAGAGPRQAGPSDAEVDCAAAAGSARIALGGRERSAAPRDAAKFGLAKQQPPLWLLVLPPSPNGEWRRRTPINFSKCARKCKERL